MLLSGNALKCMVALFQLSGNIWNHNTHLNYLYAIPSDSADMWIVYNVDSLCEETVLNFRAQSGWPFKPAVFKLRQMNYISGISEIGAPHGLFSGGQRLPERYSHVRASLACWRLPLSPSNPVWSASRDEISSCPSNRADSRDSLSALRESKRRLQSKETW